MSVGSIGKGALSLAKKTWGVSNSGYVNSGLDLVTNLAAGDSIGTSIVKAGATGIMTASNPLLMTAYTVGSLGIDAYWAGQKWAHGKQQWWNKQYAYNNRVGGNYVDTQRAQTMRQAAVQAIQGSKLNARSALGGEARILNPYSTRKY